MAIKEGARGSGFQRDVHGEIFVCITGGGGSKFGLIGQKVACIKHMEKFCLATPTFLDHAL